MQTGQHKTWRTPLAGRCCALAALFALLVLAAGCTHTCLPRECDWQHTYKQNQLPPLLESNPDALLAPSPAGLPDPATIDDPEREPYHLTLQQAFAIALESGTVGSQSAGAPGRSIDDLSSAGGSGGLSSDSIRVLSLDPARSGVQIEAGLSRFDAFWSTSMLWNATDEPNQGLSSFTNGAGANFFTSIAKPLPTGGVAGITFGNGYNYLTNPPTGGFAVLNPSYVPRLTLGFEQPLLRGFGVEANQYLPGLPGSNLFSFLNGRASSFAREGIVVARLRFDQQRADLERSINYQLLNVEAAYWTLYGAYVNLYAAEQAMRQAHTAWVIAKAQMEEGVGIDQARLAQVLAQFEQFRGDRMRALGRVIDTERTLRVLLGLKVEDGKRLVPIDPPRTAPTQADWKECVHDALNLRPELVIARQEIKAKHWNLLAQKNFLMPDLRLQTTNTTVGLGSRLDGGGAFLDALGQPVTNNALRSLTSAHYNDWSVGLTLNMPIGFRYEHAQVRDARLQLAQSFALLKTAEQKATTFVARQYSEVIENYKVLEVRKRQRLAQAEQVETRFRKYAAGAKDSPLEFLLAAQQQWATALSQEYQAIVDYNVSVATLEFAKGTIMRFDHVSIAEGALPACAGRAVDSERERTRMIVKQGHPRCEPTVPQPIGSLLPAWPAESAPTLLNLWDGAPGRVEPPAPVAHPAAALGGPVIHVNILAPSEPAPEAAPLPGPRLEAPLPNDEPLRVPLRFGSPRGR